MTDVFKSENLKMLPVVLQETWIGYQCLGPILQFIGKWVWHRWWWMGQYKLKRILFSAQALCRVDKALFILVLLANQVDACISIDMLTEMTLPGPLNKDTTFTLRDALEVCMMHITYITLTCIHAHSYRSCAIQQQTIHILIYDLQRTNWYPALLICVKEIPSSLCLWIYWMSNKVHLCKQLL